MSDAPHGSIEMLRDTLHEHLHLVGVHAFLALEQGQIGAKPGRNYNYRQAVAHIRLVGDLLKMEHEHEAREAERKAARTGRSAA
jgi:hypothetical protein